MTSMTLTKRVEAPVEPTFEVFTDLDRAAETISAVVAVERLTEGPMGQGTRWRETRRVLKQQSTEELEVSAFVRNESYTVVCGSCGSVISSTFRFVPRGEATDVVLELQVQPTTLVARMMSPLGKLMMGAMRSCMQQDLDELAARAEGRQAQASS